MQLTWILLAVAVASAVATVAVAMPVDDDGEPRPGACAGLEHDDAAAARCLLAASGQSLLDPAAGPVLVRCALSR